MKTSLLAFLFLLPLAACDDRTAREDTILRLMGDATRGADVFVETCAGCHAAGPQAGECWATRGLVVSATVYGWKFGKMPPQDELSEQAIADVAAFLSAGCGRRPDAGTDGGTDAGTDAGTDDGGP